MPPDWRLSYGLSMFALGIAMLLFTYAAAQHPSVVVRKIGEWHVSLKPIFFVGLGFFYLGAFVVSLALDPRSVARRSHAHHKHHAPVT